MNKISLSSGYFDLDRYTNPAKLEIAGKTTLNAINMCTDLVLDIHIQEGALFVLNLFDYNEITKHKIRITSEKNSKVEFNISFIAMNDYSLDIETTINGDNILNDVKIRGINETAAINITLNGIAQKNCKESVINEYAKIINTSDKETSLVPNLVVNTNEVIANHGISIGGVNEEELFYLMCKGISKTNAIKLIEEGFILSIMDNELKERIKNILLGR